MNKMGKYSCSIRSITVSFFLLQMTVTPLKVYGSSQPEDTDTLPLWELRLAATAAVLPHYIGSNEYKSYLFPLPYLIYRGEFFESDRDNMRTIFFKNKYFETDISLWGNPPVPGNNYTRNGMEELDALAEIGPALRYYFYHNNRRDALYLEGAIRTAFSVGWEGGPEIGYQGLHGGFDVILENNSLFKEQKIEFHLSSGVQFANSRFNSYFYDVEMEDVTPYRNYYTAEGGYSGFTLSGSITRELYPGFTFLCYGRWDNTSGTTYNDSPLATSENNYTIGTMFIFTLAKSEKMVYRYSK